MKTEKKLDDEILNIVYTFLEHYEAKDKALAREILNEQEEKVNDIRYNNASK